VRETDSSLPQAHETHSLRHALAQVTDEAVVAVDSSLPRPDWEQREDSREGGLVEGYSLTEATTQDVRVGNLTKRLR
jgi:hypothetical protein